MNTLTNWPDRGYELRLPKGHDPSRALPLVVAVHGYTHDSEAMRRLTSPDGDPAHPLSLDSLADREGFAVAYPNGTALGALPGRGWNAGGGKNGFAAISSPSVDRQVDDVQYFRDLLRDVEGKVRIDPQRIYVVGISNGGAMAHRLAMELADRLAAVAAVAGGNQFAAAEGRRPEQPVPVLQMHGTRDPVWPYAGGEVMMVGRMAPIPETVEQWAACNGAGAAQFTEVGPHVLQASLEGSTARQDIEFYRIEGGGHSWPDGHQFLPESRIGPVNREINANQVIWEFFKTHPRD